jgi:hypothetical protein
VGDSNVTYLLDNRYDFLRPGWFRSKPDEGWAKWDLAYLILDSTYHDCLIPYEKVNEHYGDTGEFLQAIPQVEAWIADRVPITWIERVILGNIGEAVTDHEIQLSQVHQNLTFESE